MRIIGLDLGERRIGVAISDPLALTAQALEVIDRKKVDWKERLDEIISSYSVNKLVIGFPKNMNGSVGPKGEFSQQFAKDAEERYNLPVVLWDERLSTVAVEKTLIETNMRREKRKKVIDQLAATWILQGYLESQRRS